MLEELLDRFGETPKPVQNLLTVGKAEGGSPQAVYYRAEPEGERALVCHV